MKARVVSAAALVALVAAGAALAAPPINFETPSKNIDCNSGVFPAGAFKGKWSIVCTVFSAGTDRGEKFWELTPTSRVWVGFVAADVATDVPVLGYGKTWASHGIRCASQRSGLTCRNRSGHGFFLSRGSQRVF